MSAYASLPGSFLPPFFSFGSNSPTKNSEDSTDAASSSHGDDQQEKPEATTQRQSITPHASISCPDLHDPSEKEGLALSSGSSLPDMKAKLPQSAATDTKSSPASEVFIAINNARVDTVQLIQSLTTRGSNIARRTANFISRSSDETQSPQFKRSGTNETTDTDAQTVHSKPSLCYEDSDDSDDEMSFYDYGDEDDYNVQSKLPEYSNDEEQTISSKSQDEEAIQFELFINFHGRQYRAFRAFSTFVQLRNDLLRDRSVPATVSIPELPSLNEHENNSSGGFHALARSGFAMLQATAKMYCPVMEVWLRSVVEAVPSSPILNKFLWEPLASSTAGWNDIDDMSGEGCGKEGVSTKPPQHPRNKSRQSNTSGLKYMRSKSYNTSLSSITELLDES